MNLEKPLEGIYAWSSLKKVLKEDHSAEDFCCSEKPFERLRLCIQDKPNSNLSEKDRLVRLRQALRYGSITLKEDSLPFPNKSGWPDQNDYAEFGMSVSAGGSVTAKPWNPEWLEEKNGAVDEASMGAGLRPSISNPPDSDPWVKNKFSFEKYRGPGQAMALRSILHMPKEKTLLVILPTGEGKSLLYQALAVQENNKTIAVVVPTVALAYDQQNSLPKIEELKTKNNHAYIGGQDEDNASILTSIPTGDQGLLFAAPEALVGSLRNPLVEAAKNGKLGALVVDEAHLVYAWGSDFRSDYQKLAALITELRSAAPRGKKPKVICLSATIDAESFETLNSLFSPEDESISVIPSARLRPEPDLWVASVENRKTRENRVLEALRHLPRPAILYVTEQIEAEYWSKLVKEEGYKNSKMIHGGSSNVDREQVVKEWKKGDLDLVVGTSAFGLGINYKHARSVIHACVPEGVSRYYQEIGRTGRDNRASTALLLPANSDFDVAKGIASKIIISVEKGLPRWEKMFNYKKEPINEPGVILVDTSLSPPYEEFMQGPSNETWNQRVLNLLSLAGFIKLKGTYYDPEKEKSLMKVEIVEDAHLYRSMWDKKINSIRDRIIQSSNAGFELMKELIKNETCPSELFERVYNIEHGVNKFYVKKACGGCKFCRKKQDEGWFTKRHDPPRSVWDIGDTTVFKKNYFPTSPYFVEWNEELFNAENRGKIRKFKDMFQDLWEIGIHKCIVVGTFREKLREIFVKNPWCIVNNMESHIIAGSGLSRGPEIIWIEQGIKSKVHHLKNKIGTNRIFFIPNDFKDPSNPGALFSERHSVIPYEIFRKKINS